MARARECYVRARDCVGARFPVGMRFLPIALESGDTEGAYRLLEREIAELGADRAYAFVVASLLGWAFRSRDPRFLDVGKTWLERGMQPGPRGSTQLASQDFHTARCWLAIATGDATSAQELYRSAEGCRLAGPFGEHALALLAWTSGSVDEAIAHFEKAQGLLRRAEWHLVENWNALWWAESLLERDSPGDGEHARSLLETALVAAQALSLVLLARRVQETLDRIGGLPGEPARRTHALGLTGREQEVLCLIVRGLTNKEIGDRLFVSVSTVNTHVRHILDKTGTANRAEATALAIRAGICGDAGD